MSTKIWVAYRLLRNADLWDVLHDIRIKATARAREKMKRLFQWKMNSLDMRTDKKFRNYVRVRRNNKRLRDASDSDKLAYVQDFFRQAYLNQIVSPYKNDYHLDSWVSVRMYRGTICLIPGADGFMGSIFDFMKKDPRLADWHYQNQVNDEVADQKPREWARRKAYYDGIDAADRWKDKLILIICDKDHYSDIDPWLEMAKALHRKQRKDRHEETVRTSRPSSRRLRSLRQRR